MPPSYASVLPLTTDFNETGTAFYREKTSKLSLLKTPEENTRAQGAMNPHYNGRLHPHLDVLEEFPDYTVAADGEGEGRMGVGVGLGTGGPHAPPHAVSNPWAEAILVARLRFNRYILYDGRRLHNQFIETEDYPRLSSDPALGRLTLNSFFWTALPAAPQRQPQP